MEGRGPVFVYVIGCSISIRYLPILVFCFLSGVIQNKEKFTFVPNFIRDYNKVTGRCVASPAPSVLSYFQSSYVNQMNWKTNEQSFPIFIYLFSSSKQRVVDCNS